jgi:hypothetical protein
MEARMATRRSGTRKGNGSSRPYGEAASRAVASAVRRQKAGTLESGSGETVRSRRQAIAIGLSEARAKGAKVPKAKK